MPHLASQSSIVLSGDGRWLLVVDASFRIDGGRLLELEGSEQPLSAFGWSVSSDGELTSIGAFEGVPATVAGLAAS